MATAIHNMRPISQVYGVAISSVVQRLDTIAPVPSNAQVGVLTIETNPIRTKIDADPTSVAGGGRTLGTTTAPTEVYFYGNDQLRKLRMIRAAAADAMISIEYFGV